MSLFCDVIERLLNLAYPRRCPCCDEITIDNLEICYKCFEKLSKYMLTTGVCKCCGNPIEECTCKTRIFLFDGVVAPFRYDGVAADGVLNIKKKKSIENARFFANYMIEAVKSKFPVEQFDLVTNVPMFAKEEKQREFNHSKVLAKLISKGLGIEYKNTLKQILKRKSQHELTAVERIENVKGVYKTISSVEGKNILLVDDIKTSGSTLNECAHELLLAGAESVWCVCAALTCKKTL